MASRVSSIDLREVGAAASAQPLVPDADSSSDRGNAQNQLGATPGSEAGAVLDWNWATASCLDSGSGVKPVQTSGPGGAAGADCSLKTSSAQASSSFGAVSANGVSVAGSSFDAKAWRDPKLGVLTQTTATARGVDRTEPRRRYQARL